MPRLAWAILGALASVLGCSSSDQASNDGSEAPSPSVTVSATHAASGGEARSDATKRCWGDVRMRIWHEGRGTERSVPWVLGADGMCSVQTEIPLGALATMYVTGVPGGVPAEPAPVVFPNSTTGASSAVLYGHERTCSGSSPWCDDHPLSVACLYTPPTCDQTLTNLGQLTLERDRREAAAGPTFYALAEFSPRTTRDLDGDGTIDFLDADNPEVPSAASAHLNPERWAYPSMSAFGLCPTRTLNFYNHRYNGCLNSGAFCMNRGQTCAQFCKNWTYRVQCPTTGIGPYGGWNP